MSAVCNCLINQSLIDICNGIDFTSARVGIAISLIAIIAISKLSGNTTAIHPASASTPLAGRAEPLNTEYYAEPEETPLPDFEFTRLLSYYSELKVESDGNQAFRANWAATFNGLPDEVKRSMGARLVQEARKFSQFVSQTFGDQDAREVGMDFIADPVNAAGWSYNQDGAVSLHEYLVRAALGRCIEQQFAQDEGDQISALQISEPSPEPKKPICKGKGEANDEPIAGMVEVPN